MFLLLLLMPLSATATPQFCGNDIASSTYQSNLAIIAGTLPTNASSSPQLFATATAGEAPDVVHALALCRGDINATTCRDCVVASFQTCPPTDQDSAIYYEDCLLGYSSHDLLNPPNITENGSLWLSWKENTGGDAGVVTEAVRQLLAGTAHDASASERRFATAVMVLMDSISAATRRLYSLAQCTPDLSAGDCLACLQRLIAMVNSTTPARKGARILVLRCNIRFEAFRFYDGQPMRHISPSSSVAPDPTGNRKNGLQTWLIIAVSVAAPVAVAFCIIVYCSWFRSCIKGTVVRLLAKPTHTLQGRDALVSEMEAEFPEFLVFNFHQILEATCNFSQEKMLGEGGFGPVYKGYIPGRMDIAVKRLASHSGQGFLEFKNEVHLIAKLQHKNLIRLLGCCSEGEEKILVYEYMPNKSLDFFIFDENTKASMDWNVL
uniref:Uncharacterized protein n=1 Tax=Avena sativa TaxID=4498 RepID=A0ACD5ZE26_AVESA